ncbi:hypothetical protein ROS217_23885 [Roseovarius sp. 217]|nr:hypothetical protein ROS217_23885 [Roseovarius sp. 217]
MDAVLSRFIARGVRAGKARRKGGGVVGGSGAAVALYVQ